MVETVEWEIVPFIDLVPVAELVRTVPKLGDEPDRGLSFDRLAVVEFCDIWSGGTT